MDNFKRVEFSEFRDQDPEGDACAISGEVINNWDEFIAKFVKQSNDMPPRDSPMFSNALQEYIYSINTYIRSIMLKPPDVDFIIKTPLIAKLISAMLYDYSDECKYQAINAISITLENVPGSIEILHGNAFTQSIIYVLPTICLMKPELLYVNFAQLLLRLLVLICATDEYLSECIELGYVEVIYNIIEDEKEMIGSAEPELLENHFGVINECLQFLSMAYRNKSLGIEWDYSTLAKEFADYIEWSKYEEKAILALSPLIKVEDFSTRFHDFNGFGILWDRVTTSRLQSETSMATALQIFQVQFQEINDAEWSAKLLEIMSRQVGQDEGNVSVINESLLLFHIMIDEGEDIDEGILVPIFDLCSGVIEIEPMVAKRSAGKLIFKLCKKYGINSLSAPEISLASALNVLSDDPTVYELILDVIEQSCMQFIGCDGFTEELKNFVDEAGEIDGLEERVSIIDNAIQEHIGE